MMGWKSSGIAACLSAAIASIAPAAVDSPATQPSPAQMQERIDALQSKIDQLKARHADDAATAQAIIDDADRQSPLMSTSPFLTGYDPNVGFVLQSPDGNFSMHPGLMFQARYAVDQRNSISAGHGGITGARGDNTENGFEITRMRFTLDGNLFSPLLTYYFQVGQDEQMGQMTLLDAYVMYRISNQSPLALKVGQFKDPVWHEQNLLPSRQMAVDRSLANMLVGGGQTDRIEGGEVIYDQDEARGELALHHGYSGQNVSWNDNAGMGAGAGLGAGVGAGAGTMPTNWGLSGRGEYLAVGNRVPDFNPFSEYDQFTARGDRENILVLGGGFDYTESGADKTIFHTVDAQFNTTNGWSFYAAYLGAYRNFYTNKGVMPGSFYDEGALIQAAYMLTSRIEPFVRYDYTHLDGRAEPTLVQDSLDEITIGANYYICPQAKFTLDFSWLPNGSPTDVNYLDILQDNGHNEYLLRAQFQISI